MRAARLTIFTMASIVSSAVRRIHIHYWLRNQRSRALRNLPQRVLRNCTARDIIRRSTQLPGNSVLPRSKDNKVSTVRAVLWPPLHAVFSSLKRGGHGILPALHQDVARGHRGGIGKICRSRLTVAGELGADLIKHNHSQGSLEKNVEIDLLLLILFPLGVFCRLQVFRLYKTRLR